MFYNAKWGDAWHDDFVVQGNNSDAQERTLTLQLLTPDLKGTVLQLDCAGVGIVSAKYEQPVTASGPVTAGFRVELYVERMKLTASAASVATTPSSPAASQPTPMKPSKKIPDSSGSRGATR